jgi:aminoglycoside phosphotransferase (APT) family kinase protein
MSVLDQAGNVRQGEELDLAVIKQYFDEIQPNLKGDVSITQFPGGASNLTYQVSRGGQDFILRRPPFGDIAKSAHDMLREARIIKALKPVYPYVPEIISICEDPSVLGCDFYVMEKLTGIIPRQNMPKALTLDKEQARGLCLNVIDKLIELHQVDIKPTGLDSLGKGTGYVERQITGWSDRYVKAKTDDATDFKAVMDWLKENMPADCGQSLIHNDFRLDNVVLNEQDPLQVIGVLDWEMATVGDPLMDLGNSLAYWVEAGDEPQFQMMRRQPTHLPGMLTRQEVIEYYLEKTGRQVESFVFYEVYGLFRLAVIIQQIYYRYYHGQTQDKRFAGFVHAAKYLETRCLRLLEKEA